VAPRLQSVQRGAKRFSGARPRRAFDRISQQRHHGGSERPRVACAARHGDNAGGYSGRVTTTL
jgi:hypothetical protein